MGKVKTKTQTGNVTPVTKLNESIEKILQSYAGEVRENVNKIAFELGTKGVQALKQSSKTELKTHSGDYAKGWRKTITYSRVGPATVTIYNELPGLPHLLEYGHLTRNGLDREDYKDTPAHPHIMPVAEMLVKTFEREVKSKL